MLRIRPVFLAFAALALGAGGVAGGPAATARAAGATLCRYQVATVSGGRYIVQNDEWGSAAPECVTTDGAADFWVASSAISNLTDGAPGGYPSIFAGCHWGDCTEGGLTAHPQLLADLGPGMVTSTWSTAGPGGSGSSSSVYDVAYDIWINHRPRTSGAPDGTEIMVWLSHRGQVRPAGKEVAAGAWIGGHSYDVWYNPGGGPADSVSYEMVDPRARVTDLDLGMLVNDAEQRGYTSPFWYLISVEAGFEIWRGGAGLVTTDFSVSLMARARG